VFQQKSNTDAIASRRRNVTYWVFNYVPKWEAASMEIRLLAESFRDRFGASIISFDQHRNGMDLQTQDRHLPLPLGIISLPLLMWSTRDVGINHIFASAGETRLTRLLAARGNTILTIAKDNPWLDRIEKNAAALRSLQCVVVESERHRDLMMQLGLPAERVKLIYPGVECAPVRAPNDPFTILFATSPLQKYGLLSRGVHLMIAAAARLPEIRFRFVWRKNAGSIRALVHESGAKNIEILSGFIEDMSAQYDAAHATILPALSETSLKPCPHSGLLSLAHGKPLLISRPTSLAGVVERERCGVVFEPTISGLCNAVRVLQASYSDFQRNAQPTVQAHFSKAAFIERYADLYDKLLGAAN
jgi:glycosyltransferase involved in cell wall biosynthesis